VIASVYADDDHEQSHREYRAHESDRTKNEIDQHRYSPLWLSRALWGIATARHFTGPKLRIAL
jgi:hypothetical protein